MRTTQLHDCNFVSGFPQGFTIQMPVVVVDLAFTTLLTSYAISVAFLSEHEKFDKYAQRL